MFSPVPEGTPGPALYLPGRYAQDQRDLERPEFYTSESDDTDTLIIVNAGDYNWRIPPDELKDMAIEAEQDFLASEKYQSRADRLKAMHDRWLQHWDQKRRAAEGKLQIALSGLRG